MYTLSNGLRHLLAVRHAVSLMNIKYAEVYKVDSF